MSDKTLKKEQKKTSSVFFKWSLIALLVICLDVVGIYTTIKIIELKAKDNTYNVANFRQDLISQDEKIKNLESLPISLAENAQKLMAFSNTLSLLSENFEQLNNQVGNNKISEINNEIFKLNHRIDSLEEIRNNEALMLNLVLIIKENILYHRGFAQEVDILATLNSDDEELKNEIKILQDLKTTNIADNNELVHLFAEIAKNFKFNNTESQPVPLQENVVSKGFKVLKNTILKINFDKIVVLKKERKTDHQKEILSNLINLVNAYRFNEAIQFIQNTPEFANSSNEKLALWKEQAQIKINVDSALKNIMSKLLKALRKDFNENNIVINSDQPIETSDVTSKEGEYLND